MRRREFTTLLAGAVAACRWRRARNKRRSSRRSGTSGPLTQAAMSEWTAAFVQRLRQLGWIEGRTVAIEYRWGEGRNDHLAEITAEFVRLKVDVIATGGTAAVLAAKQATSVIPIVFATAGDPVGLGLVASLARPGGNVTGLSNQSADLPGKRIGLLREVIPVLHRLAIIANVGGLIGALEMREVQTVARALGLVAVPMEIRRAEDIATAFEANKAAADALYVVTDPPGLTPIEFELIPWHWVRDCRPCMPIGLMLEQA